MAHTEARWIRPSAWPTALRWAGGIATAYFILAMPWLLAFSWGKLQSLDPSSALLALGAAATAALLVLVARLWFVRLRNILTSALLEPSNDEGEETSRGAPSLGPAVMLLTIVSALVLGLVAIVLEEGFNGTALLGFLKVAGFVIVLTMIPFYFEVRRSMRPNKLEICLALLWMAFRRTVLGLVALLLVLFAVTAWRNGVVWLAVCSMPLAAAVAWWGWFGAGYRQGFADDRSAHEDRKRRYGW